MCPSIVLEGPKSALASPGPRGARRPTLATPPRAPAMKYQRGQVPQKVLMMPSYHQKMVFSTHLQ